MKITIESQNTLFKVKVEDKYAEHLTYEEVLGLVSALTMPNEKRCLNWLKTDDQHKSSRTHGNE